MKQRLLKEGRAMLPVWGAAMGLLLLPIFFDRGGPIPLPWLALLGVGPALVFVEVFGKEFSCGTFNLLLSQPLSRRRLWAEKLLVAGAALASLWVAFAAIESVRSGEPLWSVGFGRIGGVWLVVLLCALGGGLGMSLLLRQVSAGFWFTLLLPTALFILVVELQRRFSWEAGWVRWTVMVGYAIAVYGAARLEFGRIQDAQRFGQELNWPRWLTRERTEVAGSRTSRSPLRCLISKEWHLQHLNIAVAGMMTVAGLLLLGLRRLEGPRSQDPWDIPGMVLATMLIIFPALTGGVAVAEERRLGLWGGQLTQPVSRRVQWWIKALSVYGVSGLLAWVLPSLLILASSRITPWAMLDAYGFFKSFKELFPVWLFATACALFASSLARTLMQALSLWVALIVGVGLTEAAIANAVQTAWTGQLTLLFTTVGGAVFFVVMNFLAARNAQLEVVTRRDWVRNAAVLGASLALVLGMTAALFGRVWDSMLPEANVPPGTHLTGSTKAEIEWGGSLRFLLPDGRIEQWVSSNPAGQQWTISCAPLEGIWRDLSGAYAIRSDGTLWTVPKTNSIKPALVPLDWGSQWKRVASIPGAAHRLAIKQDGSLWSWGKNSQGELSDAVVDSGSEPYQVGSDTDWATVSVGVTQSFAVKENGTLWGWGAPLGEEPKRIGSETNWDRVTSATRLYLGLKRDGSLWGWWQNLPHKPTRLGGATDRWKDAAVGQQIVGIREDGSLWRWDLANEEIGPATRVGSKTNWIAIRGDLGLTADGGIWAFGRNWIREGRESRLLPPSSRPRLVGVIR